MKHDERDATLEARAYRYAILGWVAVIALAFIGIAWVVTQ